MHAASITQSMPVNPFVQMCANLIAFTRAASVRKNIRIATLGPTGTSNEYVASCLGQCLEFASYSCALYDSYEQAADSVSNATNDLLLVANAYHDVNKFYISNRLRLSTFFVLDTLPYGLASRQSKHALMPKGRVTVATHHAPAHLIEGFTKGFRGHVELQFVQSTGEAARLAAEGQVDACITNEQACSLHELTFISPARTIQKIWSIFKRDSDSSFPTFYSPNDPAAYEIRTDN